MALSPYLCPITASQSVTAQAFDTLSSEARALLWYHEIEHLPSHTIAEFLGIPHDAVALRLITARESFTASWLDLMRRHSRTPALCSDVLSSIPQYLSDTVHPPQRDTLEVHLTTCLRCALVVDEIDNLCEHLDVTLLPLVLGSAAFPSPFTSTC
ncbi:hypothetical protein [Jonesia quinghaiensis]|uniref:hypothetical protein n=1 Tax=Jonesia quinghaiensis TaxID=262806 RepID=UPI000403A134|nr:hypothetical protein [Jonesia quinghaiensis]